MFGWPVGPQISRPATMGQFAHHLADKAPGPVNVAVTSSKPQLATFWPYAEVEPILPAPAEIPTAIRSLLKRVHGAQTGSCKQLTLGEALLNGLVATECRCGFTSAKSQASGASLAVMCEDQSLTSASFWFII